MIYLSVLLLSQLVQVIEAQLLIDIYFHNYDFYISFNT